jgi:dihydroxy-acid dehydratase
MGRVNRPSLLIYGGTIRPGKSRAGKPLDIVSALTSYGEYIAKRIDEDERRDIVRHACPGAGACGGMFTANTMASAIEALGMSLPGSSSTPAEDPAKQDECRRAGAAIRNLLELDLKPRDIMTRAAFENAIVVTMVLGGSTNAVLHLIAMAHSVGVRLTIDDFQATSDRTPFLADLRPSGRYAMEDLHDVGGVPALMKMLLARGVLDGSCITVTGKTLAENLADAPDLAPGQDVIHAWDDPIKETGHIQILRGNLAPDGCVAKITGKEGLAFSGTAIAFDSEEAMLAALERGAIRKGHVILIRYEGPRGGPGMREMLTPTSAILGMGLSSDTALVTDGRFSGGSSGFIIGHVTPEAQDGGPIALVRDGDRITIDAKKRTIELEVDEGELARRRAAWTAPPLRATRGVLAKYIRNVRTASEGCVTDE